MCGIAGIFSYHYAALPVDRDELGRIRDHMAARGPDGQGEWYSADGRVGLAHRRLAIIDLSDRAAQPMASPDGQLVITFNGEIYNYKQLRAGLEAKGRKFRTDSDTEVLLQLYAEKGEAMLQDLRGMFAFAIWDNLKRSLFLARDPFGIKPLYYSDNGSTFRVASQVKALLAGGQIDTTPEPAGHVGFYLWGSVPAPWTLYRGIRNLQAGHYIRVDAAGVGVETPFCLISDVLAQASEKPAAGSRYEALDAISSALRDSIRAHHVADVPVSVFLSAGLDSTMIAALSAERGARPVSLTLAFAEYSGTANDEAPFAESIAAKLGTRHVTQMVRREDFEEERIKLFAAMDQPSIDGVNSWFVSRAANAQGVKVALSGVGGDELFATYPSFNELPRINRLAKPFAHAPWLGEKMRVLCAPFISRHASPKYASIFEYGASLGGAYFLRRGLYMPWELSQVLDQEMVSQGMKALRLFDSIDRTLPAHGCSRFAVSSLEMNWYMKQQLLRDADWASMGQSLEVRVPLLDIPLLRTVAPWLAAHPGISKAEVVLAGWPEAPYSLLNKPKTGFSIPVHQWLGGNRKLPPGNTSREWARHVYKLFTGQPS